MTLNLRAAAVLLAHRANGRAVLLGRLRFAGGVGQKRLRQQHRQHCQGREVSRNTHGLPLLDEQFRNHVNRFSWEPTAVLKLVEQLPRYQLITAAPYSRRLNNLAARWCPLLLKDCVITHSSSGLGRAFPGRTQDCYALRFCWPMVKLGRDYGISKCRGTESSWTLSGVEGNRLRRP